MGKVKAIGEGLKAISQFALKPERKVRAYHGSPHDFDKFDISKIGTGEGAQAYGHGLYFAENENVAKNYRDVLSKDYELQWDNKPLRERQDYFGVLDPLEQADWRQARVLDHYAKLRGPQEDRIRELAEYYRGQGDMMKAVEAVTQRASVRPSGSMYEVDINADPDSFLDWDKPLREQRQVLDPFLDRYGGEQAVIAKQNEFGDIAQHVLDNWEDPAAQAAYMAANKDPATMLGGIVMNMNKPPNSYGFNSSNKTTGGTLYGGLSKTMGGRPEASQVLNEQGIPGLKYYDAGSRAEGGGTRNFVVWKPEIIDIIKKYGIAGALGAGLISQEQAEAAQQQGMGAAPKGDRLGTPSKDETMQQRLALARQMSGSADRRATGATSPERPPEAPLTLGGSVASVASGLRSSAEGVLGMGGDLSFDTGLGFRLPLAANFAPTSEDVGKGTDWLVNKLPQGVSQPIQDWTRYESKNPVERAWKWLAEQASF